MADVTIRVRSTGLKDLSRKLRTSEKGFRKMGKTGKRAGDTLRKSIGGLRGSLGGLTGILGGLGAAFGVKQILDFDQALGALQGRARLSNKDAFALRKQILGLSAQFNVNKDDVLGAANVLQDFGGILGVGKKRMSDLVQVAKATSAPLSEVARTFGALVGTMDQTPDQAINSLQVLAAQADAGTVAMKDLAVIWSEVGGIAKGNGISVKKAGTLIQAFGQGVGGNAQKALTQFENFVFGVRKRADQLRKELGIKVFRIDPKTGKKVLKDITGLSAEILRKTKGDPGLIKKVFGDEKEIQKSLLTLQTQFDAATGKFRAGSALGKAAAAGEAAGPAALQDQLQRIFGGVGKEAEQAGKALKKAQQIFFDIGKKLITLAAESPKLAAGAGVAFLFRRSIGGAFKDIFGRVKNAAGGGGVGGVQKVFVVNQPGRFGGGPNNQAPAAVSKLGRAAAVTSGLLGAAGLGFALGTLIDRATGWSDSIAKATFQAKAAGLADAQRTRLAATGGRIALQRIKALAQQRKAQGAAGTTFQGAGGVRTSAAESFRKEARVIAQGEQGLSPRIMQAFMAKIDNLAKTIQQNPVKVVVSAKKGIDDPSVKAARST